MRVETFFDSTKPSSAWELCLSSTRPRGRRCCKTRHPMGETAAMKRCAQCHGKLGLGVRSRNLFNGRWWVHVRFCSAHCESLYKPEQRQRTSQTHHPRSPCSTELTVRPVLTAAAAPPPLPALHGP